MTHRLVAALLTLAALACADPADSPPRQDAAPAGRSADSVPAPGGGPAADSASATTAVALPGLFSIMAGLEAAMARVDRGLWAEVFDTIQVGAGQVADHPAIPGAEAERIASALGPDMRRFQELDRTVHDLAVRARDAARREELGAVVDAVAELREGCTTCHTDFRARLREALAPSGTAPQPDTGGG